MMTSSRGEYIRRPDGFRRQCSTMRCSFSLVCLAVVVVVVAEAAPQRKISPKYDNVDIDMIIGNGRILTSYIKCAMDEGPCTAEGRELKKHLPDAIKSNCSGCNEAQKKNANKLITHMRTARKRDWDRLVKKFDPTGEHTKAIVQPSTTAAPSKTPVTLPAKPSAAVPARPAPPVPARPAAAVPTKLVAAVPARPAAAVPTVPAKTETSDDTSS